MTTSRDDALVSIDKDKLVTRMEAYFNSAFSNTAIESIASSLMESTARFKADTTRQHLLKRGFLHDNVIRFCYRPFDVRWLYWEPETKLLDEKRAEYVPHIFAENLWIEARQRQTMPRFDRGYVTRELADSLGNGRSSFFPLYLKPDPNRLDLPTELERRLTMANGLRANLTLAVVKYLEALGSIEDGPLLFHHAIAILHAPAYRSENGGALRQDWPRVPLPASVEALEASAALGRQLAALLDPERDVPGVSSGALRPELRMIGVLSKAGGGSINVAAGDLAITANWGFAGRGGITMPARGKLAERAHSDDERAALGEASVALLGASTCDVFLNDTVYWRNVPQRVWGYTIGGYQVLKKWLSYRKRDLLGRALTIDEARYVGQVARRIAAILLLEPQLDANYRRVCAATARWT